MADEIQTNGWDWQDYVSTYRFWGLVLASFLMSVTSIATNSFLPSFLSRQGSLDVSMIGLLYSVGAMGTFVGALLVLYFLRRRLKLALIIFTAVTAIASLLTFSGLFMSLPVLMCLSIFMRLGEMGFLMTVIAALVSGRPTLKSFLIPYSIVMIWNMMARFFAPAAMGMALDREVGSLAAAPAVLAVLALIFIAGKMFSENPNKVVHTKAGPARAPFGVFLLSAFIPFYFLYWIFNRPSELKALTPDMKQPSRGGALAMALFAPYVLPIWFHNVRDDLKDKLPERSATAIGIVTFLFPAVAAAMAQSDNNALSKAD